MNIKDPLAFLPTVERLEDRVNPSGIGGLPAPMINSAALVPPIETAYSTFATSVRTAEVGLLGKSPTTPAIVAAQADQAIAQLDAQLNAAPVNTPNAAPLLLPLLQTQLTNSGSGSLTNSVNTLFDRLGALPLQNGEYPTTVLAHVFQSAEVLMAQSFSTTSTDAYFFANNYNSAAAGQPAPTLNLSQVLPTVQTAYSTFANSVRQAEATLSGNSPAAPSAVAAQVGGLVAQLEVQIHSALATNAQAVDQVLPILHAELTGGAPNGLPNLLGGLIESAPSSGSTGVSDLGVLDAAIEGVMAQSYQTTAGNLSMFATDQTGSFATASGFGANGNPLLGAGGNLRTAAAIRLALTTHSGLNRYIDARLSLPQPTGPPLGGLAVPFGAAAFGGLFGSGGGTGFTPINVNGGFTPILVNGGFNGVATPILATVPTPGFSLGNGR